MYEKKGVESECNGLKISVRAQLHVRYKKCVLECSDTQQVTMGQGFLTKLARLNFDS